MDFFVLVVKCHILTAAMEMLKMTGVTSIPSKEYVADPENLWMLPPEDRKKILIDISKDIVDKYIDMTFHRTPKDSTDKVSLYARRLLSLGCFYLEYSDAIREGDGDCASVLAIFAPNVCELWEEKLCNRKSEPAATA